jgi:hypothetical protein
MDSEALVNLSPSWWEKQRNRLNRLLSDAAAKGLEFTAAGWLQTIDDGQQYLYLVSNWGEKGRLQEGYTILHSILNSTNIGLNRRTAIKFVNPSTLLGRGLIRVAQMQNDDEAIYTKSDIHGVEIVGPALIFAAPTKPIPATSN